MKTGRDVSLFRQIQKLACGQPAPDLPDRELLRRYAARRDESCFEALLLRHGPMVLGLCRRMLPGEHDAEDAFQATFLALARGAASVRSAESLGAWLHGVARRLARKARAAAARRRRGEGRAPPREAPGPLEEVSLREARAVLDEELARLPERFRGPLVLCCLEGRARDEAAALLGCPLGTLKSRLEKARGLLRRRLARRGLTLTSALTAALLAPAAPAAVPPRLRQAVLRASAGGAATTPKRAVVLVLALGLIAGGTGATIHSLAAGGGPDRPAPEARPAEQEAAAPADRHGDPLPPGALVRIGTVRFRHEDRVASAAVSPDGKVIASCAGRAVYLWDAATGKELQRLEAHPLGATSIAFSPDGKALASGGRDNLIRLWGPATGKQVRELRGHRGSGRGWFFDGVHSLTFSPDARFLVSRGTDHTVRLWEVRTGKEVRQFQAPADRAWHLALAPDGKSLAASVTKGGWDQPGDVVLWEVATGKEVRRWATPNGSVSLAFSPDSKTLAGGRSKPDKVTAITLWDVPSGKELLHLAGHRGPVTSVAFSGDGKVLASAAAYPDRALRLWEVATGKPLRQIEQPTYGVTSVAFLDGGRALSSWGGSNALHFWDARTGKRLRHFQGDDAGVRTVAFSPDGRALVTVGTGRNQLHLWDAATGNELGRLEEDGNDITDVVFSPDGKLLASANADSTIRLWQPAAKKVLRRLRGHRGWVQTLAFSPGGRLLASSGEDNTIRLWDVLSQDSGKELRQWAANPGVYRLAFSPDGATLAMGAGAARKERGEHTVRAWDVATGKELRLVQQKDQAGVTSLAFSPDGRMLAAANLDGMIYFWELSTGRERLAIKHPGHLTAIALSPDGRTLASANDGQRRMATRDALLDTGNEGREVVRLWDVFSPEKEVHRFEGHRGGVTSLTFSADGRRLASGSHDTTALLWDVQTVLKRKRSGAVDLSREELQALLADLSGADAARAFQALGKLVGAPVQSVPFLKQHLRPVKGADPKRVAQLLADLDSETFKVRERAATELERLGPAAEPSLRRALEGRPGLEARQRIEQLLAKREAVRLSEARAVEVLEHVRSAEALRYLESLAAGAPGAALTREARAALGRVRNGPRPLP